MVKINFILVILIIITAIFGSGCIYEQSPYSSPYFTPDEIKKFLGNLENNSTVQINATYWPEDDVIKNIKEINEQCNKPTLAEPMYMATVNVTGETITLWINASDKTLLCKSNKTLNIKPNDIDIGLSVQQVFTSPTRNPKENADLIDVYIFHEGGKELELNKTNLEIHMGNFGFSFEPISPLDNYTFKKGDILTLRGDNLFLNENKIRELFDPNNSTFSSHWMFGINPVKDSWVYAIFESSNGDEIAKVTLPEKKLYITITKNSVSYGTGETILTLPIFRIEEKIINYNIGGESTDAFGYKYNLLNLTFENNENVSLLVNLSDMEKLKMITKLEVNKTYEISYFANTHKLINITEGTAQNMVEITPTPIRSNIVLLIDASGSTMNGNPTMMSLIDSNALYIIRNTTDDTNVGVVAFGGGAIVKKGLLSMSSQANKEELNALIRQITPSNGGNPISIDNGLHEAENLLNNSARGTKEIIVLSDGLISSEELFQAKKIVLDLKNKDYQMHFVQVLLPQEARIPTDNYNQLAMAADGQVILLNSDERVDTTITAS